ncbi:unnamed protein product [Schistocephalus solidus]|uniref:WW domain-containing protein n=1 Tax=Schistocephalus solidus TaxID=70667 RepID=A0A183SPC9_SCHSO|nr:unnamed protein product [Schistocephalus solidus]
MVASSGVSHNAFANVTKISSHNQRLKQQRSKVLPVKRITLPPLHLHLSEDGSSPLPPGWQRAPNTSRRDSRGAADSQSATAADGCNYAYYYYHTRTRQTRWDPPVYPWDADPEDKLERSIDDPEAPYNWGCAHRFAVTHDEIEAMYTQLRSRILERQCMELLHEQAGRPEAPQGAQEQNFAIELLDWCFRGLNNPRGNFCFIFYSSYPCYSATIDIVIIMSSDTLSPYTESSKSPVSFVATATENALTIFNQLVRLARSAASVVTLAANRSFCHNEAKQLYFVRWDLISPRPITSGGEYAGIGYCTSARAPVIRWLLYTLVHNELRQFRDARAKLGRITSDEDLYFLTKKLAQSVILKEMQKLHQTQAANSSSLFATSVAEVTPTIRQRASSYVRKYMEAKGPCYRRRAPPPQPLPPVPGQHHHHQQLQNPRSRQPHPLPSGGGDDVPRSTIPVPGTVRLAPVPPVPQHHMANAR